MTYGNLRSIGIILFSVSILAQAALGADENFEIRKLSSKIVGGVEATPGELPFIVSLQTSSFGHFCGGSLIAPNWVLTAAHCVKGTTAVSNLRVVVGLHQQENSNGTETFRVKKAYIHPRYNTGVSSDYDFALLQLRGSSQFQPIAVNATELEISSDEQSAPRVTTAGWGATQQGGGVSDVLMKVDVPLVDHNRCNAAYPGKITDRMICAGLSSGGKDSCQGDSGGPLFLQTDTGRISLVGVVSWGEGCAKPEKCGVYSKVNSVTSWISKSIARRRFN